MASQNEDSELKTFEKVVDFGISPSASDDDWTELTKEDVEESPKKEDEWPAPVMALKNASGMQLQDNEDVNNASEEQQERPQQRVQPTRSQQQAHTWQTRERRAMLPETFNIIFTRRDPVTIERCNLLNMAKLIIKELIDSSLSHGRSMDDDNVSLQQFFVVMEHVLIHKLKPGGLLDMWAKKGILRDKKEFYQVLEQVEKFQPEAAGMNTSVQEMPNIKSALGRGRAWLRLALMQKHLADYFRLLIEKKDDLLVDYYEPGAIMLEEEGMVISGLLVGLNVIDCNLCIKGEDLDQPMGVIDFSLYLKNSNTYGSTEEEEEEEHQKESEDAAGNAQIAAILDQKNYLEELNRHLNATVANLQMKNEQLQATNALMKEDLAISKNAILQLQDSNNQLLAEKESLLEAHEKHVQQSESDITVERETYQVSRLGLDQMYGDMRHKLQEETKLRLDVEKELELQISMRTEIEMAMRLLEKDIHEKQDTVVNIRKQLEEIKAINLEMYNKLQSSDSSLQHKTQLVAKLEEKVQQMTQSIRDLENKNKSSMSDKSAAEETARKLGQQIADRDIKRSAVETDLKIEREWRQSLQKSVDQEKEQNQKLLSDVQRLNKESEDYRSLKEGHTRLKETCDEQEKALAELGSHLSQSKLKMEEMLEETLAYKEAQWTDDKEVTTCRQCTKLFSVARRKHHCRHCGGIYCNECSDNKMPLPSSSRPVRVCDDCHTLLLQRYTAK